MDHCNSPSLFNKFDILKILFYFWNLSVSTDIKNMDSNTSKLCHRLSKANNEKFKAKIRICNGKSRWIEMGWAGLKTVGLEKVWRDKGFYVVIAPSLEYGGVEGEKKMILKMQAFLRWPMLSGCPFFHFDLIFIILFANEHKLVQVSSAGIWRSKSPFSLAP